MADGDNDNVVQGPHGDTISVEQILNELNEKREELSTLIVLCEWKDGVSSMMYSKMTPRDLSWQLTNAWMKIWQLIREE